MKRLRLIIAAVWLASFGFGLWPAAAGASANFNYDTTVSYRVDASDRTKVTAQYDVTNNTPRLFVSQLDLTSPNMDVSELTAAYSDGGTIPATISKQASSRGDLKYDYQQITLKFPRQIYGQGRHWTFTVTYFTSGLVDSKGGGHTVYVPAIENRDAGDDYHVKVDVPADYGNPHFPGAQSASGGLSGGRQFYNFEKADLLANSLALAFGDSTVYQANFNFPLHNPSPLPKTVTITLPPDLNNQKSYVNKLTPAPAATRLDEDGNVLADYHLAPRQDLTVTTDVAATVRYLEYDTGASGKQSNIPKALVAKYTRAGPYWPTDGAVAAEAKKLYDPNAPVVNNVQAMYKFVIDRLSYNPDKIKFNIRQGAAKALANPNNAVCLEYADLLIAMLRSQGIPARMPVGYAYSGSLKSSSSVADSLHAWVEAYVPGIGWMTLDPTWGEKFDQFGSSDLDHFAFAVWGENDQLPAAEMSGTTDLGYQYEGTKLSFIQKVQPVTPAGQVQVQRFPLLPFLSVDRVVATAQNQVASDNNVVSLGSGKLTLGSLAPAQRVKTYRLVLGASWNHRDQATLASNTAGQSLVLATTTTHVSWWPMVSLLALIIGLGSYWLWRRHRRAPSPVEPPPINE